MHLESNMDIDNLEVDGTPTTYTHSYPDNLTIDLPQSMNLGDSATVSIDYHGFPLGGGGLGALSFSEHMGVPIISSLSEPEGARLWWPCKDIPSEKSTARMVWTVPGDLYATGNGLLQSVTSPVDSARPILRHRQRLATERHFPGTGVEILRMAGKLSHHQLPDRSDGDELRLLAGLVRNNFRGFAAPGLLYLSGRFCALAR